MITIKFPLKKSPAAFAVIRDADNCKIAQLGNSRMDQAEHEALRDFIILACNTAYEQITRQETPAQRVARLKAELAEAEAELRREEQSRIPF